MQKPTVTLQPVKSDGTLAPAGSDTAFPTSRGVFTLAAGTWFVEVPTRDMNPVHIQMQGDASIIFTSATIEETDLPPREASSYQDTTGTWLATDDTRITSKAEGTGWSVASDVGAATGGNAGAVVWNIADGTPMRTRIKIVVTTGGEARFLA